MNAPEAPMLLAFTLAGVALADPRIAAAQTATYKRDIPDSLATQAPVMEAAAFATAQKRAERGTVAALELERKGVLMSSFDFDVAGESGIDEINVAAQTGVVLHVEHESPAAELKAAAAEANAAKAKANGATSTR